MTKEMLEDYQNMVQEVASIDRMLERLDGRLYAPVTARGDGMPRGPVRHADELMSGWTDEKEAARALYEEKRQRLLRDLLAIERAIDTLPSRERTAMRMHYIEGLSQAEVAERMHYSKRQMERIFTRTVARLCK